MSSFGTEFTPEVADLATMGEIDAGKALPSVEISELHEMARGYARDEIKIFPCKPGTKVPLTEHGFKDASSDIEQIDRWWAAEPQANIALCPEDNGWGVIDVEADGLKFHLKSISINYGLAYWRSGFLCIVS